MRIGIDTHALRQFRENHVGIRILTTPEELLETVHKKIEENAYKMADGYAPFCKHIFITNTTPTKTGTVPLEGNEKWVRTAYEARSEAELPILARWVDKADVQASQAKYLDLILYSKDQINKEQEAMGLPESNRLSEYEHYIIAIKPQDVDYELPMQPITMMRNALISEGGSGVQIDKTKYLASVEYWTHNVIIR